MDCSGCICIPYNQSIEYYCKTYPHEVEKLVLERNMNIERF